MGRIRNVLFQLWLGLTLAIVGVVGLPATLRRSWALRASRIWCRLVLFGARVFLGISSRTEGRHHLPEGPAIIAAKHQSMWETFKLALDLPEPAFVLKQELARVPVFGFWARACGFIFVDRSAGAKAIRHLMTSATAAIDNGTRQIVIFPEGTRVPAGERRPFQQGVGALAKALNVPIVPVAHNSGTYWQGPGLEKRRGKIVLRYLPALPPGMPRPALRTSLEDAINTAVTDLEEAAALPPAAHSSEKGSDPMAVSPRRAKRRYLIIPLIIGTLLLGGYGALWIYGAGIMRDEIDKFVAAERAAGRTIVYDSLSVRGFPMALRAQIEDFTWEAPGIWSWSGETLHLITMPQDLERLILAPRGPQRLEQAGRTYAVTPGRLQVGIAQGRQNVDARDVTIEGAEGLLTIGSLQGQWTASDGGAWVLGAQGRDVAFTDPEARAFALPGFNLVASHDAGTGDQVSIDGAEVGFDDGSGGQPTLLTVDGDVGVSVTGYPEGALNVTVRNERKLLSLLERFGVLPPEERARVEDTFTQLSAGDGAGTAVRFSMRDGGLFVGGLVRIADLPRVR